MKGIEKGRNEGDMEYKQRNDDNYELPNENTESPITEHFTDRHIVHSKKCTFPNSGSTY